MTYLKVFNLSVTGVADTVDCLGILSAQRFHIGAAFVAHGLATAATVMSPLSHVKHNLTNFTRF